MSASLLSIPAAIFIGSAWFVSVMAQAAPGPIPQLLKDINPTISAGISPVDSLTDAGGVLFFAARDKDHGRELWKTDGTKAGTVMVKDILPGDGSSMPGGLAAMGNTVYFIADDWEHGFQLWKSDGTNEGTLMVKDLGGGSPALAPQSLTVVGSTLYFVMPPAAEGERYELWKSDGSDAGTTKVTPVSNYDFGVNGLTDLTAFKGGLFFVNAGWIWKSDGTPAGTVAVTSIGIDGIYGGRRLIPGISKLYYFISWRQGYALRATDGSGEAEFLKEMPEASFTVGAAAIGDNLFFTGTASDSGSELWKSDGTAAGTVLVKDIRPVSTMGYPESSNPNDFAALGGVMYFSAASSEDLRMDLWKTDGTPEDTVKVKDMNLPIGKYTVAVHGFRAAGNRVYFTRAQTGQENQLWSSDGTTRGTTAIKSIKLGYSGEAEMAASAGRLFVVSHGHLWVTDGTPRGTVQLTNLTAGTGDSIPSNLVAPGAFTVAGNRAFFAADDGKHGSELWSTNGASSDTKLVRDILPGKNPSALGDSLAVGERVFAVMADKKGWNLWVSDGSSRGTASLLDVTPRGGWQARLPRLIGAIDGQVYFVKGDGGLSGELWKSDGTKKGTTMVRDSSVLPGADGAPPATADTVFYRSGSVSDPYVLCRTDGTAQTTWKIEGVSPRFVDGNSSKKICRIGNVIYFYGSSSSAMGLWRSDGTTAGTYLLKSFQLSLEGAAMSQPIAFNGKVLMMFNGGPGACGLWISDGTAVGTHLVSSGLPGNAFSNFFFDFPFVQAGNRMFFLARDEDLSVELWKTDGTPEGTEMVRGSTPADVFPRIEPETMIAVGSTLYFPGWTGLEGQELWKSDGTAAGTSIVRDLTGDSAGSNPSDLTLLGSQLLFRAATSANGNEPRVLDVSVDLAPAP